MAATDAPLDIVVRFSTSNPDIVVTVEHPSTTPGASLKIKIRSKLQAPTSTARLRLIHAGKVLSDEAALDKSLNVTQPPPTDDETKSTKAKGKLPVRDGNVPFARVYIHCSVGDELSASQLAAEAEEAEAAEAKLCSSDRSSATLTLGGSQGTNKSTTPEARGFDRLLSAGFTAGEVAALRTQFLAIQAHTHTPDTLPSGADLLALEERWLDNGSNPATAGAEDTGGFGSEDAGGLADMLYGNLIGFFWPIGAMCWLMREEGVWSRRRQIAVLSGFLVNLTFGFLRVTS